MPIQIQEKTDSRTKSYNGDISEFLGRTIITPNGEYELNPYGQLVNIATSPIEVEQIAGLDPRICSFAINNPERGPTREELRLLIEQYGERPGIGKGLVILLSSIDADKRGCPIKQLVDFPISKIR